MNKMDAATKKKWVRALRSGKYRQHRGDLYGRNGSYCCLGVLAKIKGASFKKGYYLDQVSTYDAYLEDGTKVSLDGLLKPSFFGLGLKYQRKLAKMNDGSDSDPHNFKQIADYIAKNL